MPIEQDLLAYRESISHELEIEKDRVRRLIGSDHWLTDGEHKEILLRTILHKYLPDTVRVGTGFVWIHGQCIFVFFDCLFQFTLRMNYLFITIIQTTYSIFDMIFVRV